MMTQQICDKKQCTGCTACTSVCSVSAISMQADEEGFLYPVIDETRCINCNKCVRVCPSNQKVDFFVPHNTYAAWAKDNWEHLTSTSGGIASVLSRYIIKNGGVVYGAAFDDDFNLSHIRIDNEEDIAHLKGSKYLQSNMDGAIQAIRCDVNAGKKVLFVGTPCQVAGVRKVIGRENNNLYTVDIVCHGVPSNGIFKKYANQILRNRHSEANRVTFRDKRGFYIRFYDNDKEVYSGRSIEDIYYIGFLNGLFFRKSCYQCEYARLKRISDLTIGDFWGLGKYEPFNEDVPDGISCCMVNTELGKELLDFCKNDIELREKQTDEAVQGNAQLRHAFRLHRNRDKFFGIMKKNKDFIRSAKRCLYVERTKYLIARMLGR